MGEVLSKEQVEQAVADDYEAALGCEDCAANRLAASHELLRTALATAEGARRSAEEECERLKTACLRKDGLIGALASCCSQLNIYDAAQEEVGKR